jgi:hypothetical protein
MRNLVIGATLLLAGLGVANAGRQETGANHHEMGQMMQMMQNCPMRVDGATVAVTDTATGIAIAITTESGNVVELRRRIEMMAKMQDQKQTKPGMMAGRMIPRTAIYEEIPNGAKLTLTPNDPAQLDVLRKQVRAHAERMRKGDCSMMPEMMHGMGGMQQPEAPPNEDDHDSLC